MAIAHLSDIQTRNTLTINTFINDSQWTFNAPSEYHSVNRSYWVHFKMSFLPYDYTIIINVYGEIPQKCNKWYWFFELNLHFSPFTEITGTAQLIVHELRLYRGIPIVNRNCCDCVNERSVINFFPPENDIWWVVFIYSIENIGRW